MKIIIVPNHPVMGGRHYYIAKTLAALGHEVHYVLWDWPYGVGIKQLLKQFFTSLLSKIYTQERFIVHKISRLPYFFPSINGWLFARQIRNIYYRSGADVIFAEGYTNETAIPSDLPFIYDLADDYAAPADVYGSPVYKLAFKLLGVRNTMKRQCKHALAVTVVSKMLYEYAKQYANTVYTIPNGVDQKIITATTKNTKISSNNKYAMIYVTGFGSWSRAIETMEAVVALRKECPQLELTLVGTGKEVKNIQKFIKDHHAESYIHYLGFIEDRKKVFSLIKQSAIGLNISDKNKWRDAAHPIKVLEYSALGKKVVSTDLEEVKRLQLPNVFMLSNKDSLINTMRKALSDARTDKDFRNTASKIFRDYNWDTLVGKIVNIAKDVKEKHQQMRTIVHVSPVYPPALGGLEKVVQILSRTQAGAGMNVAVITSNQNAKEPDTESFPISRLKTWTIANTRIMPGLLFRLLHFTSNDYIHVHVSSAYVPELVWAAAKLKGFRYIAHLHLDLEPSSPVGFLLKLYKPYILKYVLRSASSVVVFTKEQRDNVHQHYGIPLSQIAIVPNGVEEKFYYRKPRKLSRKPRLLFVGRLEQQKNVPLLLQALQGISDKFETVFVGDGSLFRELKKLAGKLKLTNATFVGRADGEKLLHYYQQADIFVLPSKREGMPLVLLEAMAMGLPIIATDVTGNRDLVIHNKNGLLVNPDKPDTLRDALLKIKSDKKLYAKLSENAEKMATQFSWRKIAVQFEKLYL